MLFPLYVLNPRLRFPIVTLSIILANILVMGWLSQVREIDQSKIAAEYGFVPSRLTLLGSGKLVNVPVQTLRIFGMPGPQLVRPVSTDARDVYRTFFSMMFLHGGWMHLLMNMWMLWLFGPNIEDRLGHLVFTMFYALGGILAMLAFWVSDPGGRMPVIGASGAVAAVLGAYAVTFPAAKVRTLIFFIFILNLVYVASCFRHAGNVGFSNGAGRLLGTRRRLRGRHDPDALVIVRRLATRRRLAERNG
jgi:membrane associated rhomboid family serine protease